MSALWPGKVQRYLYAWPFFSADVENVSAFAGKAARMRDRRLRVEKLAAVGK